MLEGQRNVSRSVILLALLSLQLSTGWSETELVRDSCQAAPEREVLKDDKDARDSFRKGASRVGHT